MLDYPFVAGGLCDGLLRPKDSSKNYGGVKRIGAKIIRSRQWDETKDKLRQYKKKVGIDVQIEKDNVEEMEEALVITQRELQVGALVFTKKICK